MILLCFGDIQINQTETIKAIMKLEFENLNMFFLQMVSFSHFTKKVFYKTDKTNKIKCKTAKIILKIRNYLIKED